MYRKYWVQNITYHCTPDHNSPAVKIECSLIKSISRCHYTEKDWLDRVYASSETPITSRGNWILCCLSPLIGVSLHFWDYLYWKLNYAKNRNRFFSICSLANMKILWLLTQCFPPQFDEWLCSIFNYQNQMSFSIHYGFCLFVLLLFDLFSNYIMKKNNFGNWFMAKCSRYAITLISSELNEYYILIYKLDVPGAQGN